MRVEDVNYVAKKNLFGLWLYKYCYDLYNRSLKRLKFRMIS